MQVEKAISRWSGQLNQHLKEFAMESVSRKQENLRMPGAKQFETMLLTEIKGKLNPKVSLMNWYKAKCEEVN